MAYQRAYLPMDVINVSQGYGSSSSTHKLSYAIDMSGKDKNKDAVYAPFDCVVTKLYQPSDTSKNATTVWLTSTNKVLCPNGYYGYLTISLTHPLEIMNMKKGQKFKQGEVVCYEGKTGNASGNHVHLEVSKGKTAGWSKKKSGSYTEYVILNKVKAEDYLFLKDDSKLKKNKGLNFRKESDMTYKVVNVPSEPLLIHSKANYKSSTVIKGKGLNNGDEVIVFYTIGSMSYIYHYSTLGYVASAYLRKI